MLGLSPTEIIGRNLAEKIHCYFCAMELQGRELGAHFQQRSWERLQPIVVKIQSLEVDIGLVNVSI